MDRLLAGVLDRSDAQPPAAREAPEPPEGAGQPREPAPSSKRRRGLVAFGVGLLVVAAIAAIVLAQSGGGSSVSAANGPSTRESTTTAPTNQPSPPTDTQESIPLVIEQQGNTLLTRGYTMTLGDEWAVGGPGDDFVDHLGHSASIYLTGPSPAYGDSVEFLVRDEAAGSRYRTHTTPTFRDVDGVKIGQFRGTGEYATDVVAVAVIGDQKYGFELSVPNAEKDTLDKAEADFDRMLGSIQWKRD
jgi:hypothetical protein